MPVLHLRGEDRHDRFELKVGQPVRIGRNSNNDIVLKASPVSRYHAELVVDGDTIVVSDLGSARGTRVGDQQITGGTLRATLTERIIITPFELWVSFGPDEQPSDVVDEEPTSGGDKHPNAEREAQSGHTVQIYARSLQQQPAAEAAPGAAPARATPAAAPATPADAVTYGGAAAQRGLGFGASRSGAASGVRTGPSPALAPDPGESAALEADRVRFATYPAPTALGDRSAALKAERALLREIGTLLATTSSRDRVLEKLAAVLTSRIHDTRVGFWVYERASGELRPLAMEVRGGLVGGDATRGGGGSDAGRDRAQGPLSKTLLERLLRRRQPLYVPDVGADPDLGASDSLLLSDIRTVYAVPLLSDAEEVEGVMLVHRGASLSPFAPDQIDVIEAVADFAAVALRRGRLWDRLHEAEDTVRVLSQTFSPAVAQKIIEGGRSHTSLNGAVVNATVLFADMVGYTRFSEGRAPDDLVADMNALFERLDKVVERQDGVLVKFLGDAVLAAFGVPLTAADHADRAVAAAVEMCEPLRARADARRVELRVGIASGRVFAGFVGAARRRDWTLMGDVVNLAARAQAAAQPGEILISEETANQLRGASRVVVERAGLYRLPGFTQSIDLFRVR